MGAVIGIFSAKGGVGKTLLATNLAVAFAVGHRAKTALIDLNPGNGTADLLLDLNPERSWEDLRDVIGELTPQHIRLAVTPYHPGLDLLASPFRCSGIPLLSRSNLTSLLDIFRGAYDLILLDTPTGTSQPALSALELVDLRLIVLTPDGPALRTTSRYLENLFKNGPPTGLVVSQHAQGAALTPTEIRDHLGRSLAGVLPIDSRSVWANISYGEPCVTRKSSRLGGEIRAMSTRLLKMINHNK